MLWTSCVKKEKRILVCLSGNDEAQKAWLAAGGEAGHMLSARQVESWLMTGGAQLPKEIAFSGTLEEFVSLFPKTNAEDSKRKVNGFLSGAVVEYKDGNWEYFTCNVVVMGCVWGNISASSIKKKLVSERKRKCLSAFPFFVLSSFLSA